MTKLEDIKELLHDRRLINGRRDYELDNELAESIDYLLSRLEGAEKAFELIRSYDYFSKSGRIEEITTEALQQLRK